LRTYRGLVDEFRIAVLTHYLAACDGNRTKTAAALGLRRTYLLVLLRTLRMRGVVVPAPIQKS